MSEQEIPKWVETMTNLPLFVGIVANNWAKLEHAMVPLLRHLMKTSDYAVAKIVLFSSNPPARRDMLLALTEIGPFPSWLQPEIKSFCTEYERLRILRNKIVHGHWNSLNADGIPMVWTVKSRDKLEDRLEPQTTEEIKKVGNDLEALVGRAFAMSQHLQLGTSP